ncbi:CoA-transferase [Patulibacter sp. NPDC049589]|uniref:CoA-transferase n=1 Tax=Patulibacter sp. NPDC049589 TaxID=3154731 RepID=UPI00343C400F
MAGPDAALADVPSGASIGVGGFGLSGNPETAIAALRDVGADDLTIVSNNCGVDDQASGSSWPTGSTRLATGGHGSRPSATCRSPARASSTASSPTSPSSTATRWAAPAGGPRRRHRRRDPREDRSRARGRIPSRRSRRRDRGCCVVRAPDPSPDDVDTERPGPADPGRRRPMRQLRPMVVPV